MSAFDLIHIKPLNGHFTWSNNRLGPSHIVARMDCFLINSSIFEDSLIPSSLILPWSGSNHRHISLSIYDLENLGPISFFSNPLWLHNPSLMYIVPSTWNQWIDAPLIYIWE